MKPKSLILSVALVIFGVITGATAQAAGGPPPGPQAPPAASPGPRISFESPARELGRISAGQVLKLTYSFTNTGDQTLEIRAVQPSCGCTTAGTWDRRVEPGQTGAIPIQLNTPNYSGALSKTIVVTCNDPTHPSTVLQLKGTVFKPVEVTPAYVIFTTVAGAPTNETKTVRILNNQDQPLTVFEPVCTNALFTADLKTVQPGREFELRVTLSPCPTNGYFTTPITLKTSATNVPQINLTAIANVQKPVTVAPAQISLPPGPLAAATATRVAIRNLGSAPLILSNASVNLPGIEIAIQEAQAGRLFNLTANFPAGFQIPPQRKIEVTVNSNHPDFPLIAIPVFQWQRPPTAPAPARAVAAAAPRPGFPGPALPAPPNPSPVTLRPVAADPLGVVPQGLPLPPAMPEAGGPPIPETK